MSYDDPRNSPVGRRGLLVLPKYRWKNVDWEVVNVGRFKKQEQECKLDLMDSSSGSLVSSAGGSLVSDCGNHLIVSARAR